MKIIAATIIAAVASGLAYAPCARCADDERVRAELLFSRGHADIDASLEGNSESISLIDNMLPTPPPN